MTSLYKLILRYFPLLVLTGLFLLGLWGCEKIEVPSRAAVLSYKIVDSYPHDPKAFTQGLVIDNGVLYESTGLYSRSSLRRVDLVSGEVLQKHDLPARFFGEGITVIGDRIIQLTWKSGIGFVYDKNTFKLLNVFSYSGEGWGLTSDGKNLIMSDGTAMLRFLNPDNFKEEKRLMVSDSDGSVRALNELEYIRGNIYANVWKTERIARIDPETGKVTGWLDLAGIIPEEIPNNRQRGVLNGIAFDAGKEALYVTGKLWPQLFQIEIY